jgi:hypothetical protein
LPASLVTGAATVLGFVVATGTGATDTFVFGAVTGCTTLPDLVGIAVCGTVFAMVKILCLLNIYHIQRKTRISGLIIKCLVY